jgi:hypothetical protein
MEEAFAVKLKTHGSVLTRHVWANSPDQAVKKACPKNSGKRAIGVRKVRAEDVIGEINEFRLIKEIVLGGAPAKKFGMLEEDTTLDSIVFSKKYDMNNGKDKEVIEYKKNSKEV